MKDVYTTSILELLSAGTPVEDVLRGTEATMAERGHSKLYAPVLRAVLRIVTAHEGKEGVLVVLARESDRAHQKHVIEAALSALAVTAEPKVVIDDSIVGGVIVTTASRRMDHSYKSKLVELYRAITK